MAIAMEIWQMARVIWENTAEITLDEIRGQLQEIFGDAPEKSTISKRIKTEGWTKKRRQKIQQKIQQDNGENEQNNKDKNLEFSIQISTTQEKINKQLDSLVLTALQKKQLILKHRKRLERLGEIQDATMDTIDALHGMDSEYDEERIKATIVIANALSGTLEKLTNAQARVFEQEMKVCGISDDDFSESEKDRRMQSLEKLAGIHEQERTARQQKIPELMARLDEFERLEFGLEQADDGEI